MSKEKSTPKTKAEDIFCKFYLQAFKQPDDVIRFFDKKEVFSVHGPDASFIAQEYFRTLAAVDKIGAQQLATVDLKQEKYEEIVRDLILVKQRKIEVWARKGTSWARIKKASPGNVQDFEELLWKNRELEDSAVSVAVCFGTQDQQKVVGAAFADATLRMMGYCQFVDTLYLSNLEALLLQVGAKECLVVPGARDEIELKKLSNLLERCSITKTEVKKALFKTDSIDQDLSRLVIQEQANSLHLAIENKLAMASLACIINHLELTHNEDNFNQFRLKSVDLSRYMRLDQSASRSLNLFASPTDADKTFSIYGLLNKCRTAMGSRRLMHWIKQPLLNIDEIERRQNIVEIFYESSELRSALQEQLKRIPDLDRLLKKFQRKRITATLKDCVIIYDVYNRLPHIYNAMASYDGKYSNFLHEKYTNELANVVTDFQDFQRLIEGTIDLEAAQNHEYQINPSFDPEFTTWCQEKDKIKLGIEALFRQIQVELDADKKDSLELNFSSVYEWHIIAPKKMNRRVKSNKNYTILEDGVKMKITTPKLSNLSKRFIELDERIQEKQKELVQEVINVVATYVPLVETLSFLLAELDVLISFAYVALNSPKEYVRPRLTPAGTGDIILKQARHPCLEIQDGVDFIANDVILSRGNSTFQIITGPNMGGKSTYIRSAGVIVLMAQIGSFVPCSSATVSITDCIMSRLGASDSQLRGISTFMAEMQETAAILKAATQKSLIIIDELGRGTSTYDGFGLAWAISEFICKNIGCFCFFATHFHELTALEQHIPAVSNLHVTAETAENKLVLLYHIEQGPCDRSFGIHIAELAGFPDNVVQVARKKVEALESMPTGKGLGIPAGKRLRTEEAPLLARKANAVKAGPPSKKAKIHSPEEVGKRLVHDFLEEFKKLPLDSLPPAEAMQRMQTMRQKLFTQNNSYVQSLLAGK